MTGLVIYAGKNRARPYETHVFYDDPLYLRLSEAVGGHFEIVHPICLPYPYIMIVNEEGLLRGLDFNPLASILYDTPHHGQPIVGNVVIMKEGVVDGEPDIVGLDPEDIDVVNYMLKLCQVLCNLFTVTLWEEADDAE